jgi:hypothetical protein
MHDKAPTAWSLVMVPALITLIVTILRLVGQLQGWNPLFFGKPEVGGGGAILGINWLIFIFGLWFGFRLRKTTGGPPSLGKAFGFALLAIAVTVGGIVACKAAGLIVFPDEEHPGPVTGSPYMAGSLLLGMIVALVAWSRAGVVLLLYGVLARLPVVVVTWLALQQGWENTHYTKLAPEVVVANDTERLFMLISAQTVFAIPATVMLGTLFACIGAAMAGRSSQRH